MRRQFCILTLCVACFAVLAAMAGGRFAVADAVMVADTVVADTAAVCDTVACADHDTAACAAPRVIYEEGKGTCYGKKWHGRRTASGERLNNDRYQCAHKKLPFGTRIRVTNKRNGRWCVVRVVDRGPFGRGMVVDLTWRPAKELDMLRAGVVPVTIEVVADDTPLGSGDDTGYTSQGE